MKKVYLLILSLLNITLIYAIDIHYQQSGHDTALNLPTTYLQSSNYIINAESIGVQTCQDGHLSAFLSVDDQEQYEAITIQSISTDQTLWNTWSIGNPLPFLLTQYSGALALDGITKNTCPNIYIQLINHGAIDYKYYLNQNNKCVLAQTRDEAECKAGCRECIAKNR